MSSLIVGFFTTNHSINNRCPKEPIMKRFTWKPDVPDFRDKMFTAKLSTLPTKVDERVHCTDVEDQGNLGSCTGQAIVGGLEFLMMKNDQQPINLSRLYVYYQERVIENTVYSDAGAMIRDGIKACHKIGVCKEELWPYIIPKFAVKPSAEADADAATRKISEYKRITSLTKFKTSLAMGFPVVFGFSVFESFDSDAVAVTGVVPMPTKTEKLLGGHAVLAVGYDDTTKCAIVRNSWGPNWGDKGYFYLPYKFLTSRKLSDDFWSISK